MAWGGNDIVSKSWLVRLEGRRVQSYLFEVPTLKAMVGANASLGHILRGKLTDSGFSVGSLPKLAHTMGAKLPSYVDLKSLNLLKEGDDQPGESWRRGVLVRDASRLHASFDDESKARAFVREASEVLARLVPGLDVEARIVGLVHNGEVWKEQADLQSARSDLGVSVEFIPPMQVCMVTGNRAASCKIDQHYLSSSVKSRINWGQKFSRQETHDVLGQLRAEMPPQHQAWPDEFAELAPSKFLATIVADGNGIGEKSKNFIRSRFPKPEEADYFQREAIREEFFFCMRQVVRQAWLAALSVFGGPSRVVFRPLMLGGDDLLMLCDAAWALDFVISYATELSRHKLLDGSPLTVGVGVAITSVNFPFHRAHGLAEQLAGSAKTLARHRDVKGSTVDWVSVSEAWHEDVATTRQRDAIRTYEIGTEKETLVLTARPYEILGDLKRLHSRAQGFVSSKLARTRIKSLAHALPNGRFASRLAARAARLDPDEMPGGGSLWRQSGNLWVSDFLDLVEVYELARMRQATMRRPDMRSSKPEGDGQ